MDVNSIVDLSKLPTNGAFDNDLKYLLETFMQPSCSRNDSQNIISEISSILITQFFTLGSTEQVLLVPILRAGLAMWSSVNNYFNNPESYFLTCIKHKGTNIVDILTKSKKLKAFNTVIILDTVAATGDTLTHVVNHFVNNGIGAIANLQIATCFASPEAIDKICKTSKVTSFSTAFIMETVDVNGYLVPNLGGDVGDKLYGYQTVP